MLDDKGICVPAKALKRKSTYNPILSPGTGGDQGTDPGGITPGPSESITYNLGVGNHLISFPFKGYEVGTGFDGQLSNADYSDGIGFPLEEGVWTVEEFINMIAPGGQITQITGKDPWDNTGVSSIPINGIWTGDLTRIYPQMSYWIKVDAPLNQTVIAPNGMIYPEQNIVLFPGPNYRAYPFPDRPEYIDVNPADGIVATSVREGLITKELIGQGMASSYQEFGIDTDDDGIDDTWITDWAGSFRFNPGEGFIIQIDGNSPEMNWHWNNGCGQNLEHMDYNCPKLFYEPFTPLSGISNELLARLENPKHFVEQLNVGLK